MSLKWYIYIYILIGGRRDLDLILYFRGGIRYQLSKTYNHTSGNPKGVSNFLLQKHGDLVQKIEKYCKFS